MLAVSVLAPGLAIDEKHASLGKGHTPVDLVISIVLDHQISQVDIVLVYANDSPGAVSLSLHGSVAVERNDHAIGLVLNHVRDRTQAPARDIPLGFLNQIHIPLNDWNGLMKADGARDQELCGLIQRNECDGDWNEKWVRFSHSPAGSVSSRAFTHLRQAVG